MRRVMSLSAVYIFHQNCVLDRYGAIQVLRNAFFWKLDPHPPPPPPRNANNIEPYTFETLFFQKFETPHPHLRYVTLEWPLYK